MFFCFLFYLLCFFIVILWDILQSSKELEIYIVGYSLNNTFIIYLLFFIIYFIFLLLFLLNNTFILSNLVHFIIIFVYSFVCSI